MIKKIIKLLLFISALFVISGCATAIPFFGEEYEGVRNKGIVVTLNDTFANTLSTSKITIPADNTIKDIKIGDLLKFSGIDFYNKKDDTYYQWGYISEEGGNNGYFGDVLESVALIAADNKSFAYAGHLESKFPLDGFTFSQLLQTPQEQFGGYAFVDVATKAAIVFNLQDFNIDDFNYESESYKISSNTEMTINFYFFDAEDFVSEEFSEDMENISSGEDWSVLEGKYLIYHLGSMEIDLLDSNVDYSDGNKESTYYDLSQIRYANYSDNPIKPYSSNSFPYYLDLSNFFNKDGTINGDIGLVPHNAGENLCEGIFFITINYRYNVRYFDEGGLEFTGINKSAYVDVLNYGVSANPPLNLVDATREADPEVKDKNFLGWFDNKECDGIPVTSVSKLGGDYYAKWRDPNHPYTVKYVNKDADGNITELLQYDTDLDIGYMPSWKSSEKPTKASTVFFNYVFKEWDKEFVPVSDGEYDIVYTAIYEEVPREYSVSYVPFESYFYADYNRFYGTIGSPKAKSGQTLFTKYKAGTENPLPEMEWAGYQFMGWFEYYNDGYVGGFDKISSLKENRWGDVTLYAGWYKYTYNVEGKTIDNESIYSNTYDIECNTKLPSIDKTGYKFLGWTGDGVTTPKKNLSLYGRYGDKTFIANYEANLTSSSEVTYTKYESPAVEFSFSPSSDDFVNVLVDGVALNSGYTLDATNKKVRFDTAYLNTLSVNEHTVTIAFKKGSANCFIAVKDPIYYEISIPETLSINASDLGSIDINCTKLLDGFKLKLSVVSDNNFKLESEDDESSYITYGLSKEIDGDNIIYTFDKAENLKLNVSILDKSNAFLAGDYEDTLTFDVELLYPEEN